MANKFSVVVIFGEGAARSYLRDGIKGLQEKAGDGVVIKREFATKAEKDAYIRALDDADQWDGWYSYAFIDDEDRTKHPRIINKLLKAKRL